MHRKTSTELDPRSLPKDVRLIDIDFLVADVISPGGLSRVTPRSVRLRIFGPDGKTVVFDRGLAMSGIVNPNANANRGMFADGTQGPSTEATFVFHALTLCEIEGEAPDSAWCSSDKMGPVDVPETVQAHGEGDYQIQVEVTDHAGLSATQEMTITFVRN